MTTKIIVEGFKSIGKRVEVEVRPLTILAGANSSGKSSLMQALLLLKQTLEANYDPGPLLLDGPNVKFTSVDQLLHVEVGSERESGFTVGVEMGKQLVFETRLQRSHSKTELAVAWCRVGTAEFAERRFTADSDLSDIEPPMLPKGAKAEVEVSRERFWLLPVARIEVADGKVRHQLRLPFLPIDFALFREILHLPGLRGNPEREYPLTSSGPRFPGRFDSYTASVIWRWQSREKEKSNVNTLGEQLKTLGLTWKVDAKKLNDTTIELRVGRLVAPVVGGSRDMVNIADVGVGVSQTLPVLVALLEARKGQLVYIEQPEIHLHPKAQVALAEIIADAAKRGVLVVIETHSSLLLLAVQTLVAEGKLSSDLVKLHWFERDKKSGATHITSRDLDPLGRFGDWPEDFDDVSLEAQSKFLDAVTLAKRKA